MPLSYLQLHNTGGQKFATSKTALLAHKGSLFEAMISNRQCKPDLDGSYVLSNILSHMRANRIYSYFIDRDPLLFPVIMEYVRTGKVSIFVNTGPFVVEHERQRGANLIPYR